MKNYIEQLIGIPSYRGDERDIAVYIAQEFKKNTRDHKIVIQKYNKYGRNVLVLAKKPKLIVDVHLDTVYYGDIKKWNNKPLELFDDSKSFYGLGVVDVKANIAVCLELIKKVDCSHVSFVFCGGEETESMGLKYLLETKLLDTSASVVVMEPTKLKFFSKNKGFLGVSIKFFENERYHSCFSEKRNAVDQALDYLSIFKQDFIKFAKESNGQTTTYSVNGISSEHKDISSGFCRIDIGIRNIQTQSDFEIIKFLNTIAKKIKAEATLEYQYFPSFNNTKPFCKTNSGVLPFWSHAGRYQESGFLSVVFGPGDIKFAHAYNEQIKIDDLIKAEKILSGLIKNLSK